MSYSFYSFLHILSIVTVFLSLGATAFHFANGGSKESLRQRKLISMIHGTALLVAFVAGFGLMARAGFSFSGSAWIHVKLLCWLLLGVYPLFLYKGFLKGKMAVIALWLIAALAIYTVVFKPF